MRSGVTVILPRGPEGLQDPCYAGMHTLNGNGEVTGSFQIKDWGFVNTVGFAALQDTTSILHFGVFLISHEARGR